MNAPRIVVVEDESIVAMDIGDRLVALGYQVAGRAASGEQALALTEQERPDLVLMDIRLRGEMDGIAAAREIHTRLRVPVVFLTAFSEDETLNRAKLAEPFGFILKPVADRELRSAIEIALYKHGAEEEIRRLNRLYATLGEVNKAIARCWSREQLAERICRLAVEVGRFRAAWIGWQAVGAGPAPATTWFADDPGLAALPACVQASGVAAEALRLGRAMVANEAQQDPRAAGCHGVLCQFGIRAYALMPIRFRGLVCGLLGVCSAEAGFFNPDEVTLLEEAALAVSFAVDRLDDEERRRLAEADRERLVAAIEQTTEVIVVTDAQGTIQYVNPAFEMVTGYSAKEAIGANPRLLKSGLQDAVFYRRFWETIANGRTWEGCFVNRKKDGTLYTEEATVSPVRDAAGAIVSYVAAKRDITEHLRLRAASEELQVHLRQTQKMEAVGRLAGGIAHDFNNLLTTILHSVDLCRDELPDVHPGRPPLDEIAAAAQRTADLTRQLLAFARKQTTVRVAFDLNDAVEASLKLLQGVTGEDIELAWCPGAGLWPVKMDRGQADQILVNLCTNARDAITGVGRVTLTTANVVVRPDNRAEHAGAVPGEYVQLVVADNGRGMTKDVLEHVFEPFFSTKGVGQGLGLGLATVYGIVDQNGGRIGVSSRPGAGTTLRVYLPRALSMPKAETAPHEPAGRPRGSETVLLVEDEKSLRVTCGRFLEVLGYTVLSAAHPAAALTLAEQYTGEIHLLLTDVVMPGMNGVDLAAKLEAVRPTLKCLFMSGYTADAIANRGVLEGGMLFLQKPFSRDALARKVREALGAAAPTA